MEGGEGGGGGRRVGLQPLRAALDTPRPAVLCPVEGMLRSDQNKHIPPSPHPIPPVCPLGAQGTGQAVEEVSAHPTPTPHWETQGTQRTEPLTRSQAGQGQDFPGGPAIKTLRSQYSGHGFNPLAGDLVIRRPHILHQAAQAPAQGKPQEPAGHTKSGNSHHALKWWGKGVEEQRAELRPWHGTVNTPQDETLAIACRGRGAPWVVKLRNHSGERRRCLLKVAGQSWPGPRTTWLQTQLEWFRFSLRSPWSQLLFNIVKGK